MPADKKYRTLARQWELLKLLPTRGAGKTAAELTRALKEAGFPVTKRSVERDLNDLLDVFRLDRNDKSPPYGWRWPYDTPAALPGITVAEALSLRLVQDTLKPLLPASVIKSLEPRFRQAEAKLATLAERNPTAQWADKVRSVPPTLPLLAPAIDIDVLETVQEALLANQQLEADYCAMGIKRAGRHSFASTGAGHARSGHLPRCNRLHLSRSPSVRPAPRIESDEDRQTRATPGWFQPRCIHPIRCVTVRHRQNPAPGGAHKRQTQAHSRRNAAIGRSGIEAR